MTFGETPQPKRFDDIEPFEPQSDESKSQPRAEVTELTVEQQEQILLKLGEKLKVDRNAELTQQEASLVYQVDQDLPDETLELAAKAIKHTRDLRDGMNEQEIRQLRDYEQVKALIKERLTSEKNVIQTSTALEQVMEGLGVEGYNPEAYMQALIGYRDLDGVYHPGKMTEWEENGVFDYLTIELIKNNNRHNIVPVPNAEFNSEQIIHLAKMLGRLRDENSGIVGYSHKTWVVDEAHPEGKLYATYTPAELSGVVTDPDQAIRLSLVPSKLNPEFESKTIEQQLDTLADMQNHHPELNFQVPSVLTAVVYWYVLWYEGIDFYSRGISVRTSIINFNLPIQLCYKGRAVPNMFIKEGGGQSLAYSMWGGRNDSAKVSVG